MVKSKIILPNGTKITVDGTIEEVIKIKQALIDKKEPSIRQKANQSKDSTSLKKISKEGPLARIRGLIEKDFFKKKRIIEEVRKKLEENAIFYKVSDLSTSLIRLVRKGELRRLKEENQWRYVNP